MVTERAVCVIRACVLAPAPSPEPAPDGGLSGEGTSPFSRIRFPRWATSSFGAADISAAVYGWLGRSKTASVGPVSMIRPKVHHRAPGRRRVTPPTGRAR